MKKVIVTVIMFAIAIALITGVIIPLSNHGRDIGTNVEGRLNTDITPGMNSLDDPVHP